MLQFQIPLIRKQVPECGFILPLKSGSVRPRSYVSGSHGSDGTLSPMKTIGKEDVVHKNWKRHGTGGP